MTTLTRPIRIVDLADQARRLKLTLQRAELAMARCLEIAEHAQAGNAPHRLLEIAAILRQAMDLPDVSPRPN